MNILIIEQTKNNKELENILLKQGISAITVDFGGLNISQIVSTYNPSVILFNTNEPNERLLQIILDVNNACAIPIVLFSDDVDTKVIDKVIKSGVSGYVVNGRESKRIKSIIDIAIARFSEQKLLKDELEKTKSKLEERKLMDRAKGILMKTRGLSEDESYHTLRKLAMNRNIAISEMAKNVISMVELLE